MKKLIITTFCIFFVTLAAPINAASFLVFGDMPYSFVDTQMLQKDGRLFNAVQKEQHDFIVHVGDLKASIQSCSDSLLTENYQLISSVSSKPFVYTPGDNDWTDCDRESLLEPKDELERLDFIRKNFAYHSIELEQFQRQPTQPENQAWRAENIQYVTLHVVATNNGRRQINLSDKRKALNAVDARDSLNLLWLGKFLGSEKPSAMVIFMQADLFVKQKNDKRCDDKRQKKCDGLRVYRERLDALAQQVDFPILLVHGDTPKYCFSKRSSGLWQLNAPGDVKVIDIAKVMVDANDVQQPFRVSSLLGSALPECPFSSED
ncbi:hypothetical protein PALB_9010 [Pseudoalteromonas luteoviolacea B = ATCC 29581]|nr:hypothetical protein PALB_9010 [Pseudoalteromonas luteoviolacea B = ATCC 29581]